ncbi:DNA repair helicase RAD25 [Natronoarchaeum philippinense]|uniref:DNA 3'-5' helicase n=1 Tax=Natronoarchaeum philippinense TaxID=558529 RepID=A0A285NTN2_NATPI|nr:DEAD/DEAH box helicase family protein [Natronoarchaeum philippinense]SNZ12830.1 DNA repair helicase RAD25 [Natronoarchaeum philippinense]
MLSLSFEDGTLRIDGADAEGIEDAEFDPRSETYRAPAHRYGAIRERLDTRDIEYEDRALDLDAVPELASSYQLREYQTAALDAWREDATASDGDAASAPRRGVLELPTGSGKTVIGLAAIADLSTPTLVVVPTIDLLEQWREELETEFGSGGNRRRASDAEAGSEGVETGTGGVTTGTAAGVEIGQLGGGVQRVGPITVATYDSAYLRADELGDRFGLVIFDEVHHLGGEGYREIARLLAAPARLGLTATFERPDDAHEVVAELVGPVVHSLDPDELAGEHLSPYDVRRLSVELTEEERAAYEENQGTFTDYLAQSNLQLRSGSDYQELVKRSGSDPAAREALLAKQRAREIMMSCDAKVEALAEIFDRHRGQRTIVFTAHNDFAYRIAERFLAPAITHRTPTAERRDILEKFRDGEYTRVVTSNVLDEGIDVPDASVAAVLSGSGSEREFTQRLGRILRPSEETERALLYEVVADDTAEEGVASRRR